MAKKDKYTELCGEIAAKVNKNGNHSFSKSDLVSMTQELINTPEHEVDVYAKNGDKEPTIITTNPVKNYRDSLKPILKNFGVDSAEAEKIDTMPFGKKHAEAICDLATCMVKDYTATGRKLNLPITSKTDAQMSITQDRVKTRTTETNKIVKDEATGKFSTVPTGNIVTTKEHSVMKAGNAVPYWLKETKSK